MQLQARNNHHCPIKPDSPLFRFVKFCLEANAFLLGSFPFIAYNKGCSPVYSSGYAEMSVIRQGSLIHTRQTVRWDGARSDRTVYGGALHNDIQMRLLTPLTSIALTRSRLERAILPLLPRLPHPHQTPPHFPTTIHYLPEAPLRVCVCVRHVSGTGM